jgi:hypothetical protein
MAGDWVGVIDDVRGALIERVKPGSVGHSNFQPEPLT